MQTNYCLVDFVVFQLGAHTGQTDRWHKVWFMFPPCGAETWQ